MIGNHKRTVFIDLDGVGADWLAGVAEIYGHPLVTPELRAADEGGTLGEFLGVSLNGIWRAIDHVGQAFWEGLPAYPDALEAWNALGELPVNRAVLTKAHEGPGCRDGKRDWVWRHFGKGTELHITNWKARHGGPGRLLVDDRSRETVPFKAAGGDVVLMPRAPGQARADAWAAVMAWACSGASAC